MLGMLGELERDTANALERVIKEEKARVRSGLGPYAAPSEAEGLTIQGDQLEPTVRLFLLTHSSVSNSFLSFPCAQTFRLLHVLSILLTFFFHQLPVPPFPYHRCSGSWSARRAI
jgi:hypothetical protein